MVKLARMALDSQTGLGTLACSGLGTFECGGRPGFGYDSYPDTTLSPSLKYRTRHSQEYNVDMQWAVLWIGQRGVYIHAWPNLSGSAGCIHLNEDDAETFFNWVDQPTRLLFSWK